MVFITVSLSEVFGGSISKVKHCGNCHVESEDDWGWKWIQQEPGLSCCQSRVSWGHINCIQLEPPAGHSLGSPRLLMGKKVLLPSPDPYPCLAAAYCSAASSWAQSSQQPSHGFCRETQGRAPSGSTLGQLLFYPWLLSGRHFLCAITSWVYVAYTNKSDATCCKICR